MDQAISEDTMTSEFPCTVEAVQRAHALGLLNVAGVPNVRRRGPQSGNVSVPELLADNLVDILVSGYVPHSLLACAFMMAADEEIADDLPAAICMMSKKPADVTGFTDRGEIAVGKRADILRIAMHTDHPFVKAAWRQGQRVW